LLCHNSGICANIISFSSAITGVVGESMVFLLTPATASAPSIFIEDERNAVAGVLFIFIYGYCCFCLWVCSVSTLRVLEHSAAVLCLLRI
jgi:hypothetical protein